ncbi:MAG TPA: hypothetical protein PLG16_11365 [Planctomycetota bacterium]|nr:hypothetical protein [Planctomycetota bacterium]
MMYCGISNRDYFIIKVIFSQYNIIVILFTLGRQCCSEEGILLRGGNLLWGQKLLWDGSCSGKRNAK